MSNIYEALQQAQSEKKAKTPLVQEPESPREQISPPKSRNTAPLYAMDAEMFGLYQNIEYLLPDCKGKIIQFIGSREGEGVSTIVRQFAHTAIGTFGKRVLIIDAAHHNPSQHIHYKIDGKYGWKEALSQGVPLHNACFEAGTANLFLSPLSFKSAFTPQIHNRTAVNIFSELKSVYDLILIDSSPATTSPESLALARYSDGVILVLEAEKTRWQMAESVKDRIVKSGGNILGVVFNKRRHYIPEAIYKML